VDREEVAGDKKKARKERGWVVFQDESGASQKPPLRRTWAPKGETPVVVHSYKWDKLSVSAAIAYRWDGERSRVYFDIISGSYDSQKLIEFLKELKRHFRGTYVVLIWDGLMAHKSAEMKAFLDEQRDWLQVEQLPGYAPDLNPVELLWGNIKGQELANQSADDLAEVADAVKAGFGRVQSYQQLTFGFLEGTGLSF
jgi:transposase